MSDVATTHDHRDFDECPNCGQDGVTHYGHESNDVYSAALCHECDWGIDYGGRDTGFAVKTGHFRNWKKAKEYREQDMEEKAAFVKHIPRPRNIGPVVVEDESTTGVGWAKPDPDPLPPISPDRHRTGTCFDNESREMRAACVDQLQELLDADVVLHEMRHQRSGYHTDLVFADVDPEQVARRDDATLSREPIHDPYQRFNTWWHCYERAPVPQSDAIGDGYYSDPSKNKRHVSWLLDNGYLARTATGLLVAIKPPRIAELHAVELKLRNWQKALEQAARANGSEEGGDAPPKIRERYGYADYRWVALDAGGVNPALNNLDAFREEGVGLVAVTEGGSAVKHLDAEYRPRERYTRDRGWVESEVWDRLDIEDWVERGQATNGDGRVVDPGRQVGLAKYKDRDGLMEVSTDE